MASRSRVEVLIAGRSAPLGNFASSGLDGAALEVVLFDIDR